MNKEDKSKLQLIGEIAEANNKNLELIEEINKLYEVLDKIKEYLKNKNYLNVGYFIEDEEGRNVFIDVKGDILDIIKEEKYE